LERGRREELGVAFFFVGREREGSNREKYMGE
jgi:hypothetical protein